MSLILNDADIIVKGEINGEKVEFTARSESVSVDEYEALEELWQGQVFWPQNRHITYTLSAKLARRDDGHVYLIRKKSTTAKRSLVVPVEQVEHIDLTKAGVPEIHTKTTLHRYAEVVFEWDEEIDLD